MFVIEMKHKFHQTIIWCFSRKVEFSDLKSFLCEQHFLERNWCGRDLSILSSSTRNVTWSLLPFHFLSNQPLFSLEGDISFKCALLNVSLNPNTSLWDLNEKELDSKRMFHKTLRCWLSFERLSGLSSLWGSWGWGGTWRWWGWGAGAGGKFFLRLTSLLRGPAWSIIISGFVKTFQLRLFDFTSCAAKRLIMERRAKKERRYILGKPISLPLVSFAQCPL